MFGIILIAISTFFEEISNVIGKAKAARNEESPYSMAFLSIFWMVVCFFAIAIVDPDSFTFSSASIPTFTLRAILEIVQWYFYVFAVIQADRTMFSFVRTLTIPLLLLTDIFLGYSTGIITIVGILIIVFTLSLAFANGALKRKGLKFVVFSAINAVLTTSLLKYNISHYNSVVAEQLSVHTISLIFFFALAITKSQEKPLQLLIRPGFFIQSITIGVSGFIESFSYNYGIASVIVTAKRAFGILWSILTGNIYFKEKRLPFKIGIATLIVVGLACLAQK